MNAMPHATHRIAFGSETICFRLERHQRDQLRIDVEPDLTVQVRAPQGTPLAEIEQQVHRKGRWILKQLDFFQQFQPLPPPKSYVSGESHYYLGRQYRLKLHQADAPAVKLIGRYLHVYTQDTTDAGKVAQRVELWYRQHARALFADRVQREHQKLRHEGIPLPEVKLRKMPQRWGSYTRPGTIVLNPDLVKAPLLCIEYVIVHELCHLKHPHHGPEFWSLLRRVMPDYEHRKERLELAKL